MAVYHCHTHPISRSGKSGSAIACAAYRAGERLEQYGGEGARSAAALAAYRTGEAVADGSGTVHDYTRKGGVAYSGIMLPEGVDAAWARDRAALWNQAEGAERQKNSRVAREWRVALPHELGREERIELARQFAGALVRQYGVAADVAVHEPSRSGDQRNWHAHILCTTRQITNEGFAGKAEIEWSNTNLAKAGKPYSALQIREVRMLWAEIANTHLERAGEQARIDHRSHAEQGIALEAPRTVHVGQHHAEQRDREIGTERIVPVDRLDMEQSKRNAAAIEADPSLVIDRVARDASAFTRRDVARTLHRYVNEDWGQFDRTLNAVMDAPQLVCLMEGGRTADSGTEIEAVHSTRALALGEAGMLDRAERLGSSAAGAFSPAAIERGIAAAERGTDDAPALRLSEEQRGAVETIGGAGQLAVLRGVAGTGKTTALAAVREAAEADGRRIVGGALAGKAAGELRDGSGIEARTLASWERSWEAGFDRLERGDVFVMDEAGMVGAAQMDRILARVEEAGAKIVLTGDERQLQPIEAGAAFRTIKDRSEERGDFAELSEVRRQRDAWQRDASQLFGRGEAARALDAYNERGAVRMLGSVEETRAALVENYFTHRDAAIEKVAIEAATGRAGIEQSAAERSAVGQEAPGGLEAAAASGLMAGSTEDGRPLSGMHSPGLGGSREAIRTNEATSGSAAPSGVHLTHEPDHLVTAYRNVDVDKLNEAIRAERVARGEIGEGTTFRTDRGTERFAAGDKVLLTGNDRQLGVANGDRGTVIGASEDRLDVRLRNGREVRLEADGYNGVRHGYAVTTHKSQGMTVDRVHVMAGQGMHSSLAYVTMTRQREGATLYAPREHFRNYEALRNSIGHEQTSKGVGDYLPRTGAVDAVRERIAATDAAREARTGEVRERTPMAGKRAQETRAALREAWQASAARIEGESRDRPARQSPDAREPKARQDSQREGPSAAAVRPAADERTEVRDERPAEAEAREARTPEPSTAKGSARDTADRRPELEQRPDARADLRQRLQDHAAGRETPPAADREGLRDRLREHAAKAPERTEERAGQLRDRLADHARAGGERTPERAEGKARGPFAGLKLDAGKNLGPARPEARASVTPLPNRMALERFGRAAAGFDEASRGAREGKGPILPHQREEAVRAFDALKRTSGADVARDAYEAMQRDPALARSFRAADRAPGPERGPLLERATGKLERATEQEGRVRRDPVLSAEREAADRTKAQQAERQVPGQRNGRGEKNERKNERKIEQKIEQKIERGLGLGH